MAVVPAAGWPLVPPSRMRRYSSDSCCRPTCGDFLVFADRRRAFIAANALRIASWSTRHPSVSEISLGFRASSTADSNHRPRSMAFGNRPAATRRRRVCWLHWVRRQTSSAVIHFDGMSEVHFCGHFNSACALSIRICW